MTVWRACWSWCFARLIWQRWDIVFGRCWCRREEFLWGTWISEPWTSWKKWCFHCWGRPNEVMKLIMNKGYLYDRSIPKNLVFSFQINRWLSTLQFHWIGSHWSIEKSSIASSLFEFSQTQAYSYTSLTSWPERLQTQSLSLFACSTTKLTFDLCRTWTWS